MAVQIEKTPYAGWPNCYRLSDGRIELIVTSDVGPRVIRCGFVGGANEFAEFSEQAGLTGGDEWRIYGGHRLWHSPESRARTYSPDNFPVTVETFADGLEIKQPVETNAGIEKRIRLTMMQGSAVKVEHGLRNAGVWQVEMAVWCLSVLAPGGTAVVRQNRQADAEGLLANRVLILWPYTEMSDPRYTWGAETVRLRQEIRLGPTKFGLSVPAGWAAYANGGRLFLKEFEYDGELPYPDGGASVEVYTNQRMLELETLSPLLTLEPGETLSHTEIWSLHDGFELPADDRRAIETIEALRRGGL